MSWLKNLLEKWHIDHKWFNAVATIVCIGVVLLALNAGVAEQGGLLTVLANIAISVGTFLAVMFGLQFFLGGVGLNVIQVAATVPVALAIYMAGLMVAMAFLIKG